MNTKKEEETVLAGCCQKVISLEEAILNEGMCNVCMDEGVEECNRRMRMDY